MTKPDGGGGKRWVFLFILSDSETSSHFPSPRSLCHWASWWVSHTYMHTLHNTHTSHYPIAPPTTLKRLCRWYLTHGKRHTHPQVSSTDTQASVSQLLLCLRQPFSHGTAAQTQIGGSSHKRDTLGKSVGKHLHHRGAERWREGNGEKECRGRSFHLLSCCFFQTSYFLTFIYFCSGF